MIDEIENIQNSGQYVWGKKEDINGDIIKYAVSNNQNEYPNGGWQNGYYWELVTLIQFTVTCTTTNITKTYQAEAGMTWSEWLNSQYADMSPSNTAFGVMGGGFITAVNGSASNLNRVIDSFGMYFNQTEEIYDEQYKYTGE